MTINDPYFFIYVATKCRKANSRGGQNLDHFIAMRLGIPSGHGKDSDLLRLGAAVGQRQGHLPVGGTVCGVGSGNLEHY